jgi:hypothetical protein
MKNMSTQGIGTLVNALSPLVELLTAFPQLIMLPLTGVIQSVVGKLIPNAEARLKGLNNLAKQSAHDVAHSMKFAAIRSDNIVDSITAARTRAGGRLGLATSDDIHIKALQQEYTAVIKNLEVDREALRVARLTNDESSKAVQLIQRRLDIGRSAATAYKQAISLTKEDLRYAPNLAAKQARYDFRNASANSYDRTQDLISSRQGNIFGQAKAMGKGMAAQWNDASNAVNGYKVAIIAANVEAGKGPTILQNISGLFVKMGIRAAAFGNIAKLAMQGFAAAIPILGWIITAVTLLSAAFDFFKSEKTKALEAYNDGLKEILATSIKVNEEVTKFRDRGQFGKAFEADVGSMKEVIAKLKEGIALRGKSESDFKTKSVNVSKKLEGSDLADADKKLLDQTLARIEKFKSPVEFKKLSTEILTIAKSGGDFGKSLDKAVEDIIPLEKSWTNIAESAKKGGDAVRKFYGADAYKTDYTDIADQLREFGLEVANQQKGIANSPGLKEAVSSSVTDLMKGGREYFEEMDRLR